MALLPADESGHGFDNVTVGDLPPALLDRYISAAQKISQLAIGSTQTTLQSDIIRVPPDVTQEDHLPGVPLGTRGGVSTRYTFVQDGDYDIEILLQRNHSGNVEGLRDAGTARDEGAARPDTDRDAYDPAGPEDGDDSLLDKDLKLRVPVTAGPHDLGVTFAKTSPRFSRRRASPFSRTSTTGAIPVPVRRLTRRP